MPHDRKGRLIEPGDIVTGKGYNIPHQITGEAVTIVPGSDSCNIQVATVRAYNATSGTTGIYHKDHVTGRERIIVPTIEYGACKDFEIVQKHDGSMPAD